MFQVKINTAKGLHVRDLFIDESSCLLGKKPDNPVVLHGWRIDGQHARLYVEPDGIYVEDLNSKTGTKVNGEKVSSYGPLNLEDVIEINDYRLNVTPKSNGAAQGRKIEPSLSLNGLIEETNTIDMPSDESGSIISTASDPEESNEGLSQSAELSEHALLMHQWRLMVRQAVHEQMDLRRINVSSMSDEELRQLTAKLSREAISTKGNLPSSIDLDELIEQVVAEAVGLGPLEPLLEDDDISEIMVNSCKEVFYERAGRMYKSDVTFTDDGAVLSAIERIVSPIGRRIDESSPMVDARLKDGSRINAVIPPLALKGPSLTIRKFMKEKLSAQNLIGFGSLNKAMVEFLEVSVRNKRNILISGGTGSGKTTLLNVLSGCIPEEERIVTIEDSAELRLYQPNLVSLEARPSNQEGRGGVAIRDLVRNSLRMRPDRIVVGECRGSEALDMLQAMNTGHDGSLTTAHANSPRDCISRIEVMVMMAGMDLPAIAIREQIASAINIIIQQTRFPCGSRKIVSISEVVGIENGRIQLSEVFRFNRTGYDDAGKIVGDFAPTGLVPEFYEELKTHGVDLDLGIFEPEVRG